MSVSYTHLLSHFTATQPQPQSDCYSGKDVGGIAGGAASGALLGGIAAGGALAAVVAKALGYSRGMLRLCNHYHFAK